MSTFDLANRHRKPLPGLRDRADPIAVKIVAGHLQGKPGVATTLVYLVNLLCRLKGSVSGIVVEADGPIDVCMPHQAAGAEAVLALQALATWATNDEIKVYPSGTADYVIHLGDALDTPGASLYAHGDGWRAWVGAQQPGFARAQCPDGVLGPAMAAAFAAGEVFKRSRQLQRGRFADDLAYSLWSGQIGSWERLADGPSVMGLTLPPMYLIGAGAVGQGMVQLLGSSRPKSSVLVTVDHDSHDPEGTNLNRCFLAGHADRNHPKIDVVGRYRRLTAMGGYEFKMKVEDYLISAPHTALTPELVDSEREGHYRIVFSAVDKNRPRRTIQGLHPDIIVGGSTDGLRAQANLYHSQPGSECLACHNEADETVVQREAELRGMTEEQRMLVLQGAPNLDEVLAFLREPKPACGAVGETDLRHFLSTTSEFSVSFVSMAAAVMATARLLGQIAFAPTVPDRADATILQFKNLKIEDIRIAANRTCQYCKGTGETIW